MFNNHRTWGALCKAWRGYVIAKNKYEYDKMEYYASVIQKQQNELGLKASLFPDMELSESHLNNNTEIIQQQEGEEKQRFRDDNYEGEYFEDDFNNADMFTS